MYIQQGAPAAFPLSSRIQAIFATLAHAMKTIRMDNNVAQSDALGSGLGAAASVLLRSVDLTQLGCPALDDPIRTELRLWLAIPLGMGIVLVHSATTCLGIDPSRSEAEVATSCYAGAGLHF